MWALYAGMMTEATEIDAQKERRAVGIIVLDRREGIDENISI